MYVIMWGERGLRDSRVLKINKSLFKLNIKIQPSIHTKKKLYDDYLMMSSESEGGY